MRISSPLLLTLPRYVTTTEGRGGMCVLMGSCDNIPFPSSDSNVKVQFRHFFCTKTSSHPYTHILHMTAQCNVLDSMCPRKIKHDSLWNATGTKAWFTAFTQISVLQRATNLPIPPQPRLAEMWFFSDSWQSHQAEETANSIPDMKRCVLYLVWRNGSFSVMFWHCILLKLAFHAIHAAVMFKQLAPPAVLNRRETCHNFGG